MGRNKSVFKFVLTGGSCGGKTTATLILPKKLEALGYNVFVISEVSTDLDYKGHTLEQLGREQYQREILQWQIAKENFFINIAQSTQGDSLIICDRGALDGSAYVTEEMFNTLLNELNIKKQELYNRYDAVFHMTSIALDAPEKYENKTNPMRRENIEASKIIDKRLQDIWSKHPNRVIIDNSTPLDKKIERVFTEMTRSIETLKRDNER